MPKPPNPPPQCVFELCFRKEMLTRVGLVWVRNESAEPSLPDVPAQFIAKTGSYYVISREASRLNDAQHRSGFQHYLFFPEPVKEAAAA